MNPFLIMPKYTFLKKISILFRKGVKFYDFQNFTFSARLSWVKKDDFHNFLVWPYNKKSKIPESLNA